MTYCRTTHSVLKSESNDDSLVWVGFVFATNLSCAVLEFSNYFHFFFQHFFRVNFQVRKNRLLSFPASISLKKTFNDLVGRMPHSLKKSRWFGWRPRFCFCGKKKNNQPNLWKNSRKIADKYTLVEDRCKISRDDWKCLCCLNLRVQREREREIGIGIHVRIIWIWNGFYYSMNYRYR